MQNASQKPSYLAHEIFTSLILAGDLYKTSKLMTASEFAEQNYPLHVSDASTLASCMIRNITQHDNFNKIKHLVSKYGIPPEGAFAYAAVECDHKEFVSWFISQLPTDPQERLGYIVSAIVCDNVEFVQQLNEPLDHQTRKAFLLLAIESNAPQCFQWLWQPQMNPRSFLKCAVVNQFILTPRLSEGRPLPTSLLRRIWKEQRRASINLYRDPYLKKTMVRLKQTREKSFFPEKTKKAKDCVAFVEYVWPMVSAKGQTWLRKQSCMKNHPLELQRALLQKSMKKNEKNGSTEEEIRSKIRKL